MDKYIRKDEEEIVQFVEKEFGIKIFSNRLITNTTRRNHTVNLFKITNKLHLILSFYLDETHIRIAEHNIISLHLIVKKSNESYLKNVIKTSMEVIRTNG